MKQKRLHSTDWILIALFALSLVAILLRFRIPGAKEAAEEHFLLVGEWRGIDRRTLACLQEGDALYTPAGAFFGDVIGIEWLDENDGRGRAVLRISVSGGLTDGVLMRGGTNGIYLGESYLLYSELAELRLCVLYYEKISAINGTFTANFP